AACRAAHSGGGIHVPGVRPGTTSTRHRAISTNLVRAHTAAARLHPILAPPCAREREAIMKRVANQSPLISSDCTMRQRAPAPPDRASKHRGAHHARRTPRTAIAAELLERRALLSTVTVANSIIANNHLTGDIGAA